MKNRVVTVCVTPSAIIAVAIIRTALRFAELAELPWSWWLPSLRLLRDIDLTSSGIFVLAVVALSYGIKQRSHSVVAITSLTTVTIVYLLALDIWLHRPGDYVDPRVVFTMRDALVPLYVSILALTAHATIALRARND